MDQFKREGSFRQKPDSEKEEPEDDEETKKKNKAKAFN
jgi:hypothetical protein